MDDKNINLIIDKIDSFIRYIVKIINSDVNTNNNCEKKFVFTNEDYNYILSLIYVLKREIKRL